MSSFPLQIGKLPELFHYTLEIEGVFVMFSVGTQQPVKVKPLPKLQIQFSSIRSVALVQWKISYFNLHARNLWQSSVLWGQAQATSEHPV